MGPCRGSLLSEPCLNPLQEMVPNLLSRVQEVFPLEQIWTPPDMEGVQWTWPSIDELVDVHKKRVMFLSGVDYGREMNGVVFSK